MVGGLKMILFQKFFLILFYITKLQYKPPGTKKVCLSPPPTAKEVSGIGIGIGVQYYLEILKYWILKCGENEDKES